MKRRRRVQPIQSADAAIGDGYDGALQLEAETRALAGGLAGRTHDCCQDGQRKQPSAMVKTCAALPRSAYLVAEPPPFLCEALAPLSWLDSFLFDLEAEPRSHPPLV
jgi:hypothetical protein